MAGEAVGDLFVSDVPGRNMTGGKCDKYIRKERRTESFCDNIRNTND